ncbi:M15 family metallopeptidase [Aquicella lusitana]|uniref:D-alanyl-D-alanine carboxypeptidase-like protein n=1 Tax=Aquicella lusitana TaxID=254246 RepID=A0A370GGX8_9COXI|nr:M15 family metallopeptidase [Aquicella lusitana]RDI42600.1 D-alanyl-D-alanine carboxypeptidase-like protein [Aquicella lusitana]VVC74378.1 hypothetical protein AQULUS_21440 [Aquicella lusitana]
MVKNNGLIAFLLFVFLLCFGVSAYGESQDVFKRLHASYPDSIDKITWNYIAWKDGTRTPIRGNVPLLDYLVGLFYGVDYSYGSISKEDVLKDSYESFFKKMYGKSSVEVNKKLVTIYWMPNVFGKRYPLKVTTVNGVDKKLRRISAELEKLPPSYYKYLANPAGSFYWRKVAGQSYLSSHSFGIAIDINSSYSNYWLWDVRRLKRSITEIGYRNRIPLRIVEIFEKEGFFWGGRWFFYDTMHFEYRPELVMPA